jgi:hypothetical protein
MNKKQLFKKAHEIARHTVRVLGGSYQAAFAGALKLVQAKGLNFRLVGDTFACKKEMNQCGFRWNPNMKCWEGHTPNDCWAFSFILIQMKNGKIKNIIDDGNAQAHAWMAAAA